MRIDWEDRKRRVEVANNFLEVIAAHGRRFFYHDGVTSRFELDMAGRVWFVDKYTEVRIYTHQPGWWGPEFTEGGTLQMLCLSLRDYIMCRGDLPVKQLGPWPPLICGGDLWGYGDDMTLVRIECRALAAEAPR